MKHFEEMIRQSERYGARNYGPLPVVITAAEGVWVEDASGNKYMDMLSAYSAHNQGHRHPAVIQALKEQADKVTLTSRAFHSEVLGDWMERLSALSGKERVLPMNTGAEAVETALKIARRWAYDVKGVPDDHAEIIVCEGNFHGRTLSVTSFSTNAEYTRGFGPFTPGFRVVPYGDLDALSEAITANTAAFLVEPIQGEAGIRIPPDGYLSNAAELCKQQRVLLIADEIQTGFGRTGKLFACQWEQVNPDIYTFGKALGGGILPISAVCADSEVMDVLEPGSHGSTFGGNPLACAVSIAAMNVIVEEQLPDRSLELGDYLIEQLRQRLTHPRVKDIRGRGLFVGIELTEAARLYCERLLKAGILAKDTHIHTVRLAPPLIIDQSELDWAIERVVKVLNQTDDAQQEVVEP
ncbi:ornithine--oxo-acid transaminase [Paenibacillus hexagrammi]|uniref:Ornithine aminotransferase n=1 Tax=Paenibacillus hexagrammi TaxID=2908839 RepID=A0ABY3SQN8_9BACL|nr:ornithine--oxo-acid transaminase [Paenibacillus sp. YPD9-1]UJF35870.1 ornithine--oxo-acid transaminase [Paenibacillus sp. YPD9-1]